MLRDELSTASAFARPYVISWNLTYRCNLACEHCYLDAGGTPLVGTENFADRSELGTEECFRVIDEIAAFAPECVTILTGGEPLLRRDILEIVRRAAERGLWVVVGTNGVRITENVARRLAEAGARGLSLSLDALDRRSSRPLQESARRLAEHGRRSGDPQPDRAPLHRADDRGLAQSRRARGDRRLRARSPRRQGLEPLLPGADGARAVRVGHHPGAVRRGARLALPDPEEVRPPDAREREVRAALHQDRSRDTPFRPPKLQRQAGPAAIRTYSGGAGGCPAGTHYMGIRPNGDVTPCPYLPVFAGTLRSASLADLWTSSELFADIRRRTSLGGRCGECEMNGHCGGCRARAYGMTGDLMAEDPLCTHTPGTFAGSPLLARLARQRAQPQRRRRRNVRERLRSRNRVRSRIAGDDRVGRCGRRAHEEDPCVRPGDGGQGGRGFVPQERHRPRHRRGAGADPRADADAEDVRVGALAVARLSRCASNAVERALVADRPTGGTSAPPASAGKPGRPRRSGRARASGSEPLAGSRTTGTHTPKSGPARAACSISTPTMGAMRKYTKASHSLRLPKLSHRVRSSSAPA